MAKKPTARTVSLPPPVGGWNARDQAQRMQPVDALLLDNFIPDVKEVRLRSGKVTYATGMPGPVESLMEYTSGAGSGTLIAAAWDTENEVAALYDVTTAGAVGTPLASGLTNARWQHTMFATTGGQFLCMVNGDNGYYTYNGSLTDQTASITGVSAATFVNVMSHMSRLWFAQEGTSDVWYLDALAITGAATKLPLGPFLRRGGSILAMGSWTRDGGSGMDDFAVFVSTRGEVLIYQGTDPASPTTWAFVGRFEIAEPIGPRCLVKAGGDIAVLTAQGLVPLSPVLDVNESGQVTQAFTDKIVDAYRNAYYAGGTAFGWQVIEFPSQNLVIANVPVEERNISFQFALNVRTGSWSRWKGLDASSWSRFGSRLFFGGTDGVVYEYAASANDDDGEPIVGSIIQAYSDFKTTQNKRWTMARPRFRAPAGFAPRVTMRFDYDDTPAPVESITIEGAGPPWDTAFWDEAEWGASSVSSAHWQTVGGIGTAGAMAFAVSATVPLSYEGCDLVYEIGGVL